MRPRWGVRTSNPGGAASRSLVGSTPTLLRLAKALQAWRGLWRMLVAHRLYKLALDLTDGVSWPVWLQAGEQAWS